MNQDLTFSIIIPTHNSAAYIKTTLFSIIKTKYDFNKYEVILIDDGSTDDTVTILKDFVKFYPNFRIYQKSNGNWGSVINYVKHNKLINCDYVVILDSDDILSENFFCHVNKNIKDANILMLSIIVHGKKLNYYVRPYWFINREVKQKNRYTVAFAPFSIVLCKELFYQAPELIENVRYQDYYLFFSLLKKAKKVRYTTKIAGHYIKYRLGNTMSAKWNDQRMKEEIILHHQIQNIGLSETLILRLLMQGYTKKARQLNYKVKMIKRPKALSLPWWIRWCYWLIYFFVLRHYITF